jgi:hypothetical protein
MGHGSSDKLERESALWWEHQKLDKVRTDKTGTKWHVRIWRDSRKGKHVARVFFWNDERDSIGVVLLPPERRTDVSALRSVIEKLAADPKLRAKHRRKLQFPLERYYSQYGAFREESERQGRRSASRSFSKS